MTASPPSAAPRATAAERLVCGYITATPLLWVLGLQLPAATLLAFGVFALWVRAPRALRYAWPWFLVGALQMVSVLLNMWAEHEPLWRAAKHVLASYVSGWLMFGAAVAIGASGLVRPRPFLRRVGWLGAATLAFALVLYPLALISHDRFWLVLTPVGRLLPVSLPSTSFRFAMLLFNWEDLFGIMLPRLSIFSPWTTALGFSGACLVFIVLNDPDRSRRWRGAACGVFMVVASMGRLAIASLAACLLLRWYLARPLHLRIVAAALVLAGGLALPVWSTIAHGSPQVFVERAAEAFDRMRPSATGSRELVYQDTWDGIWQAPWFGHGWPGEAVYPEDYPQVMLGGGTMVPGSHSTTIGLVYLGGVITFAAFLFAFARTTLLIAASRADPSLRHNTLALLGVIGLACFGEGLFSLVVPTLFAFIWLGMALRTCGVPLPAGQAASPRPHIPQPRSLAA